MHITQIFPDKNNKNNKNTYKMHSKITIKLKLLY